MAKEYHVYQQDKLITIVGTSTEAVIIRSQYPTNEHHLITIRTPQGTKLTLTYKPFKVIGKADLDGQGFIIEDILGEFVTDVEAMDFIEGISNKVSDKYVSIDVALSSIDYGRRGMAQSDYYLERYKKHKEEEKD